RKRDLAEIYDMTFGIVRSVGTVTQERLRQRIARPGLCPASLSGVPPHGSSIAETGAPAPILHRHSVPDARRCPPCAILMMNPAPRLLPPGPFGPYWRSLAAGGALALVVRGSPL